MAGYTKLFNSIITSTIWAESKETKILWITMLAMSDARGFVEGSIPGLAAMSRLSIEEVESGLTTLKSPDPYSRSKEYSGIRIEEADGGWRILNYEKYRERRGTAAASYAALKQASYRSRQKEKESTKEKEITTTEEEAYTEAERYGALPFGNTLVTPVTTLPIFTLEQVKEVAPLVGVGEEDAEECFHHFNAQGWKRQNGQQITDIYSILNLWKNNRGRFTEKHKVNSGTDKPRTPGYR